MKLLVTGGAGFIGSNFARRVLDGSLSGFSHLTVLDKLTYAGSQNSISINGDGFEFIKGDICDSDLVNRLVLNHDVVVNFAAETHVDRSILSSENFIQSNIKGVHTLLEAIKVSSDCSLIQISTDEVYGSTDIGSFVEESPILPNSPYSASKASADLLCRAYATTYNLDIKVTRCSNNYGPFQNPEKLIPLFVTNILEGKKLPLYGSGNNVRDWIHVDDHCRAIHAVIERGVPGDVYNIGGGFEITNLDLTKMILTHMGKNEEFIQYVEDRKGHDFRYSVDWNKISSDLGYSPKVKFETGITETIQWYQDNRSWWENLKFA
jgi:dTDP-glucose 4,6-dehydratase